MPASFFDTNVLVYLMLHDDAKADAAERLVASGGTISVQVLNEIANVARRKRQRSWAEVRSLLQTLQDMLTVEPLTLGSHVLGLGLADRYRLSVYDGMIVASALLSDCDTLWSEDMQDGMVIERQLVIRNPFRAL
jgi:predicted nucleic acid-binding protein